jgi:hypothetical protein
MDQSRAIAKFQIGAKHARAEPSLSHLYRLKHTKLIGVPFIKIPVLFKKVRNVPKIPGSGERHHEVELELFAQQSLSSGSRAVGHVLIQPELPNIAENGRHRFPFGGPASGPE